MNSAEIAVSSTLRLEGELTIYRAAELHAALRALLDGAAKCALDLSQVTEIDSCGVQLLLAARRFARENDCELAVAAPSAAVLEALTTFGLTAVLDTAIPNNEDGANAATLKVDHADGA